MCSMERDQRHIVILQPNLSNRDILTNEPNINTCVGSFLVGTGPNIAYTLIHHYAEPDILIYSYKDCHTYKDALVNVTFFDSAWHKVDIYYPSIYCKLAFNYGYIFDFLDNPGLYDIGSLDQGNLVLFFPNGTKLNGNSYTINVSHIIIVVVSSEVYPGAI